MVVDAAKAYLQIANGLTEVTRERATSVARSLATQPGEALGGAAAGAVSAAASAQSFAEELILTSRDNRALLIGILRSEAERLVTALGFAKESEVEAVRAKVDRLEHAVGLVPDTTETDSLRAALAPTKRAPAKKRAPAAKAAAKKVPASAATKKAPKKAARKAARKTATPKASAAKDPKAEPVPIAVPTSAVRPADRVEPVELDAAQFEATVLEQAADTITLPDVTATGHAGAAAPAP